MKYKSFEPYHKIRAEVLAEEERARIEVTPQLTVNKDYSELQERLFAGHLPEDKVEKICQRLIRVYKAMDLSDGKRTYIKDGQYIKEDKMTKGVYGRDTKHDYSQVEGLIKEGKHLKEISAITKIPYASLWCHCRENGLKLVKRGGYRKKNITAPVQRATGQEIGLPVRNETPALTESYAIQSLRNELHRITAEFNKQVEGIEKTIERLEGGGNG